MGSLCSKCNKTGNKKNKMKEIDNSFNDIKLEINYGNNLYISDSNQQSGTNLNQNIQNNISPIMDPKVERDFQTNDFYFEQDESKAIYMILEEEKTRNFEKRQIINYKKGSLIGEGSYGRVYQGFDEDIGQIIAIKEIDLRKMGNNSKLIENKISSFQSEIDILSQLNHKNIVKYYGTKRSKETFHIFLEFCIGGSILKMLETYKKFSENVIRKYTKQILEGLEYLHMHNVVHRDIKGANILVERDGLCKLSDFGGAKVIKDEIEFKQQNSFKGTPNWMAPETVKNLEYTRFSDIWSLGCTIIEMATGEPPWAEYKNPMAALYNLMHTNMPPSFPNSLSENCKNFLSCCLKIKPRERLNVCKLLKHPFIIEDSPLKYEISYKHNKQISKVTESEIKRIREDIKLNSQEIETRQSENFNNLESCSSSLSNLKSESGIHEHELNTDINKNFNTKLINETVNSKDIKLENIEKISEVSVDKKESKMISIRIPGRKLRKSKKNKNEDGSNI